MQSISRGTLLAFLMALVLGCGGGNRAATVADFEGDWVNVDDEFPNLSLDEKGDGILGISFSDGSGQGFLSMSRVSLQHEGEQFFIETSINHATGSPETVRFDLVLQNKDSLKLTLVDHEQPSEFTLKREVKP
jgi:hypothetical protein